MKTNRIVVHSLIKTENQPKALTDLSDGLLDLDSMSLDLIEKLEDSYRNTQLTYAVFTSNQGDVFPLEFDNYCRRSSDQSFIDFSKKAVEDLRKRVESISRAKGGYLVFSEYEAYERNHVGVYLIRDTIGMLFKKDKDKSAYVINPAEHLDLNKLAMACKIDVESYRSKDGDYLSFMKGARQEYISDYFIKWISAQNLLSNKTLTNNLYELINAAKPPKDENGKEIPRDVFRENVHDLVNNASKNVNINTISEHLYGDRTVLRNTADEKKIRIDTEFRADRREMKRFVRIDLNADGIQIRFSRDDYNTKIWVDDKKEKVIINSTKLAAQLLNEMDISNDEVN
jgi:nucleoid-associated protein